MGLVFCSSLPRSGSTLLSTLLSQNENNYCSTTSDLIELVVQVRNTYLNFEGFQSQGMKEIKPRIRKLMKGMLEGFYEDELSRGKTVFDKSRGWMAYIELLEEILEEKIKIICCVRDVRDIVASFERLYRTNQLTKSDAIGEAYFDCQTIDGRVEQLLSPASVLGISLNRLRDVFDRKVDNRLIIVPYTELVNDPISTILEISTLVGSSPFICKLNNIEQKNKEDDTVHKMELHTVRENVNFNGSTKFEDILPDRISNMINDRFPFIQELVGIK